ncbi:uncharacterized protein LOC111714192 [Eurytemora carolleeae]|uniref:uncharacterized protein LOC111714192 n=1 Tax=Eurytemora carolleeae TaxID=1294199 RepID=UPI000C794F03|nr:uncharacterized protein LOC111714192 [Eurytemora carolleeae]|eukprot:XP_023345010.1 uncharacterized protein LOC111714192 [Eurytemora affinis]
MRSSILHILLYIGIVLAQRDIVVNQRARQRRPIINQVASEVSSNEDKNRISSDVTQRDRSFDETPYFERGVSERHTSSSERVEAPYLERGGSARRRININEIRRENSADEYSESISEDSNIRQVPDMSDQVQVQRRTVVRQRYSDLSTRIRTAEVDQTNSRSTEVSPEVKFEASPRSRSRSRLRSRVSASEPSVSAETRAEEPDTFRQRGRSRLVVQPTARSEEEPRSNPRSLEVTDNTRSSSLGARGREYSRNSIRAESSVRGSSSTKSENRRVEIDTKNNEKQVFRVKFPKKNLIPGVPRIKIKEYQRIFIDKTGSFVRRQYTYCKAKKPIEEDEIEPNEHLYEYEDTNIQSSKPEKDDFILVTHQVAAKTIFTVLDGLETKSLFIDTYTTSLQTVSIRSLQSTNIEDSTVIFANVHTSFGYGVQEHGKYTRVFNYIQCTDCYRQASLTPDISNIGSLLQNVLLGILGNNLLPGLGGLGGSQNGLVGPQIPGPPHTKLITHTRD